LQASEADIIALQELSGEQAAAIERDLGDSYPHQVLYGYGVPGKGLLSRYPIVEEELFYLEAQRLPHLRTVVTVDKEGWGADAVDVTVIVAHPPPPGISRRGYFVNPDAALEIASLAQMTKARGPSVLMGDFNMVDQSENYSILTNAGLEDAFREAGWGFGATWPARKIEPLWPMLRLDYIWYSAHIQAVRAWVGSGAGSDHLPVFAELVWQEHRCSYLYPARQTGGWGYEGSSFWKMVMFLHAVGPLITTLQDKAEPVQREAKKALDQLDFGCIFSVGFYSLYSIP
jgi:vancomycin resistance protein VanJ